MHLNRVNVAVDVHQLSVSDLSYAVWLAVFFLSFGLL